MHVHEYMNGFSIGMESRLREMSRQLSLSELSREQLSSDLEALRLQVRDIQRWESEKQVSCIGHVYTTYMYM